MALGWDPRGVLKCLRNPTRFFNIFDCFWVVWVSPLPSVEGRLITIRIHNRFAAIFAGLLGGLQPPSRGLCGLNYNFEGDPRVLTPILKKNTPAGGVPRS